MSAATKERLVGASVFDQQIYDALRAHQEDEQEVIDAYQRFSEEASSETVRYLIGCILDDERRHHQVLAQLADTVRAGATLEPVARKLPAMDVRAGDGALREATRRFLQVERRDRAELKRLARTIRGSGDELNAFVVDLLQADTARHIRILRYIGHLTRHSVLR